MMGVTSIHTHPSESEDVRRCFRFGRNANRRLSRGLLDGVLGGVVADVTGLPRGLENRPRRSSTTALDNENSLEEKDGEESVGDMGEFGVTFRGVDGGELVVVGVASPSKARRLRSRRRRRGRNGHEPEGETHSFSPVHSGMGEESDMHVLWAALAVTST